MTWRLARSLERLRADVNAKWPNRSKASDGSIGDASHSSRLSDHNPTPAGIVCAIDITNDPAHGLSSEALAQALVASRDSRIKYIISNRKICSSVEVPWVWRPYTGINPHNHHVHVSVKAGAKFYDDSRAWDLSGVAHPAEAAPALAIVHPTLRKGDTGEAVKELQRLVAVDQDGDFGALTEAAVKVAQVHAKLVPDGIAGPYTWEALTSHAAPKVA